jgi:hypothetical protein
MGKLRYYFIFQKEIYNQFILYLKTASNGLLPVIVSIGELYSCPIKSIKLNVQDNLRLCLINARKDSFETDFLLAN